MPTVQFFFDVVSPYSYLASTQLSGLAERTGATVVWRPVFLAGVMKATGNQPPATLPARGAYLGVDLQRWVDHYGIDYAFPPRFPVNTLLAQRALCAVAPDEVAPLARRLFRAMWVDGRDLSDADVVAQLVGPAAAAAAQTPPVKAALKANTDEVLQHGAFGAPSFVVDGELYFGNDRLRFVEAHLRRLAGE